MGCTQSIDVDLASTARSDVRPLPATAASPPPGENANNDLDGASLRSTVKSSRGAAALDTSGFTALAASVGPEPTSPSSTHRGMSFAMASPGESANAPQPAPPSIVYSDGSPLATNPLDPTPGS